MLERLLSLALLRKISPVVRGDVVVFASAHDTGRKEQE